MTQHQAQQPATPSVPRYKITFARGSSQERVEYGYFADDEAANRYARQTAGNRTVTIDFAHEPQPGDQDAPYGLSDPGAAFVERIAPDVPGEAVSDLFDIGDASGLEPRLKAQDYVMTGAMMLEANRASWAAGKIEADNFPGFGSEPFAEAAVKATDEAFRLLVAFGNAGYDLNYEIVRAAYVGLIAWREDGTAVFPSAFDVKNLLVDEKPKPYQSYVYTRTLEISVQVTGKDKVEAIAHGHDIGLRTLIERGDVKVYAHTARLRS